jgi:hypothetical protein
MARLYKQGIEGRQLLRRLAEAIILQALEDTWSDDMKWDSMDFFRGEGFEVCADILGMGLDERRKVLLLAKGSLESSIRRTIGATKTPDCFTELSRLSDC